MSSEEPFLELEFRGQPLRGDADNLSLFQYRDELADHNHVWVIVNEISEEEVEATHVWHDQPAYQHLVEFIVSNKCPLHLNLREVAQCDIDARNEYIGKMLLGDLGDFIPEQWDGDGAA